MKKVLSIIAKVHGKTFFRNFGDVFPRMRQDVACCDAMEGAVALLGGGRLEQNVWKGRNVTQATSALAFLACLVCALMSCTLSAAEETFPIMAWGWVGWAGEKANSPALYEEMKECGFSIAGFAGADAQIEAAGKAGMKVLYTNDKAMSNRDWMNPDVEQWRKDIQPIVEKYKDNDTVFGYYVKDEPNEPEVDGVLAMGKLMKELAPEKMAYMNLFPMPNSASPSHFAPRNYYDYTDHIYGSDYSSSGFDQYVFYFDGFMRPTFYKCMEIHRELSLKHGKQWWYCALSIAHRYYADPTFTQLAHQAFSALAYGARGLSWFTYLPVQKNGWYNSPLDDFMQRTHTWYDLKYINSAIQNYAYVLNHLKSDRVYHFGSTVPETDERVPAPDADSLISGMEGSSNWLIGEFTHEQDGGRWLIIVNKNLNAPVECKPIWRKQPSRIKIHFVNRKGEDDFSRAADTNIFRPGMGALIHVYFDEQ